MERSDSVNAGNAGQTGAGGTTGGSASGGASGGGTAGSQGFANTAGGAGTASGRMDAAKSAVTDRLGTVKEKASNMSATLADRLEAGAEKLRQRGQGQQLAGAGGQTMGAQNDQLNALSSRLAGGMQGTAEFLRSGDVRGSIEQQVRENPARTLLIAVGVGYLLGKALKR